MKWKLYYNAKYAVFFLIVKGLTKPFLWANTQKKQTPITRIIRAAWRAL